MMPINISHTYESNNPFITFTVYPYAKVTSVYHNPIQSTTTPHRTTVITATSTSLSLSVYPYPIPQPVLDDTNAQYHLNIPSITLNTPTHPPSPTRPSPTPAVGRHERRTVLRW